jgi:hypothetical protein
VSAGIISSPLVCVNLWRSVLDGVGHHFLPHRDL